MILAVAGVAVASLGGFCTALWACRPAGVTVSLQIQREGDVFDLEVRSADREALLKSGV